MDLNNIYSYHFENDELCLRSGRFDDWTVQDLLDDLIPSKKVQHSLMQDRLLLVGDAVPGRNTDLAGNTVRIRLNSPKTRAGAYTGAPAVLYEDELLLAVHKVRDLLVHTDGSGEDTLTDMVDMMYEGTGIEPHALHRLDRDTEGIVLFSKSEIFQPLFDKMMSEKLIKRIYQAVVKGHFPEKGMDIDLPIGRDRHNSGRYLVSRTGKDAVTHARLEGYLRDEDASLVTCILETGRTHQIRVHLSHSGFPILNDRLYGMPSDAIDRMGLRAVKVNILHPFTKQDIIIEDHIPPDWEPVFKGKRA